MICVENRIDFTDPNSDEIETTLDKVQKVFTTGK
jgi:hypothetical protein